MSRFDGARQGFAVWLWAILVAVVVAIVAAVAGARYDVLSTLNTFPRIPVNQGDLTSTGIIALVVLLLITLLGAIIGGLGGMRYHRKLEATEAEYLAGWPGGRGAPVARDLRGQRVGTPCRMRPKVIPSTRARHDASTMLGATPTVFHDVSPSDVSMSTRVTASVPCAASRMRTRKSMSSSLSISG